LRREQVALALEPTSRGVRVRVARAGSSRARQPEALRQLGLRFERHLDVVEHAEVREDAVDLKTAHDAEPRDLRAGRGR
jgi:hypothetical protein